jgi:hypothetical protein
LLDTIERTSRLDLSDRDRQALRQIEADFGIYVEGYRRVLSMIASGQLNSARDANARFAQYKDAIHRIEASGAAINIRALDRISKMT